MTQRYTKFGHSANKNAIAKKQITQPGTSVIETTETEDMEYPQTANVSETGPVLFVKKNLITPIKKNFQSSNSVLTKQETKEVDNSKTEFKSKSTVTKNKSAAQRIIGTVLKIVLWAIILAVVVGVILILGALA